MKKVVLITGIGGDISQGVATILRECRPDLRLIGIDVHSQHGGHKFVDYFTTVPGANEPGYLDAVRSIALQHSVDIVIPMSEPELAATRPFKELAPNARWIVAGTRVVDTGLDKQETARVLAQLGLPVPWTIPVGEGSPVSFPCIFKSRFGSGSRAVHVVRNDEDGQYLSRRFPDAIFQEMLEPADREVTCAVFRTLDGRVATLQMLRRLTGGFTGWAKVIDDAETERMCSRIAEGLELIGPMNVQLRLTDRGPRVFEINPRFSSTVLMRHRLGFSDVLWAVAQAEGKPIDFPPPMIDTVVVRTQGALVLDDEITGVDR